MGVSTLRVDSRITLDGDTYRLRREVLKGVWQLESLKSGRFIELTSRDMQAKIADGSLLPQVAGEVPGPKNLATCMSEEALEQAQMRLAYVKAVSGDNCTRQAMIEIIADTWKRIKLPASPPSLSRVYVWRQRYISAGSDIHALVDNTRSKGNRKPRYSKNVLEICETAINQYYLRREGGTIQMVLDAASARVVTENRLLLPTQQLSMPTRRLIKRLIDKIPAFDRDMARMGRDRARMKYRSMKGHVVTDRPLARAEIDHTIIDLLVVDERYGLPLGRPYVTVCIDDFTRCILGVYVGFNPPSLLTVAKCLKHCFRPKVNLNSEFPEIKSEWLAYGCMTELMADNGMEFHSESLSNYCETYGITLNFAARKQGYDKAKIERFLGTMNRALTQGIRGTTFSNTWLKGDYDPSKYASVSLSTFRQAMFKWIVDVYHQQTHRSLHATPQQLWESSIDFQDIPIPTDMSNLDAHLGRAYKRVLTPKGIEFECLFYNSPELTQLRLTKGTKLDVEIRVDEDDISSIYVLDPSGDRVYQVPALNQAYALGMNMALHKQIKERQRVSTTSKEDMEALLEAKQAIQEEFSEAYRSHSRRSRKKIARMLGDDRLMQPNMFTSVTAQTSVAERETQLRVIESQSTPTTVTEINGKPVRKIEVPSFKPIFTTRSE